MATTTNAPIHEVLNRTNYQNWRPRMKRYLLIEDLWEVIEATAEPNSTLEVDEAEYKDWTKKNDKALYAIQNSCGDEMFSFIREKETAKSAWHALERVSKLTIDGWDEKDSDDLERYIPFMDSVKEGNWDKAKECLVSLDVHSALRVKYTRDEFGHIALHVAAQQGHAHIVKELVPLMIDEDLKTKNCHGSTALHVAAGNENLNVVKQLVQLMTPEALKEKNNYGYSALHIATSQGYVEIVKELVLFMGEVKDNDGDTALHIAVQEGRLEIVKALVVLMRREDLAIKNDEGDTALHLAFKNGSMTILKELLTKPGVNNVNEDDFERYIPFTDYVIQGDWNNASECLRELEDPYGAITTVDPRNEYGDTSLHTAIRSGHSHIVKELLELLKLRQEDLGLNTPKDFKPFCSLVELEEHETLSPERANYILQQHQKMVFIILEVQNASGHTALYEAVLEGNIDIVRELVPLMRPEGFEVQEEDGRTALYTAVLEGNIDIVRELVPLMRPEGFEVQEEDGRTALYEAVLEENIDIVRELVPLMRPEGFEVQTTDGCTALYDAVLKGTIDIVRKLAPLMRPEGFEVQEKNGRTALYAAVLEGNIDIVRELVPLMRPEGFEVQEEDGRTALCTAVLEGNIDIVRELVPLMRPEGFEVQEEDGRTALYTAVLEGNIDIVRELVPLMRPEGFEVQTTDGRTALYGAVLKGNIDIVRKLVPLMRPEGFEVQEKNGRTALYAAVLEGNIDIVRELVPLMRPEGFEVQEEDGRTALYTAVLEGNIDIVRELVPLMRPEGFEVQTTDGRTALYGAVLKGNIDIVRKLVPLMRPEGFEVQEKNGRTALNDAVLMGNIDIVRELVPLMRPEGFEVQTTDGRTALYNAVLMENIDIVRELVPLMRPEGFEVQNTGGRTALYGAVLKGNIDIVRKLVPLMRPEGFEVQEQTYGRTPLYGAVLGGNMEIVKELLPMMRLEGFEVQEQTYGRTALHEAVMHGNMEIVREIMPFMRLEGIELKDNDSYNALHYSICTGIDENVMEVAKHMADRNKNVFGIWKPRYFDLPVFWAYSNSKIELGHYLHSVIPLEFLMPEHRNKGASLITTCFRAKYLDLALHLLQCCPILAITESEMTCTAIEELAGMRSAFLSGSQLGFWQKFFYNRIHIEPSKCNIDEVSIHISKQEDHQRNKMDLTHSVISLYKKLVKGVCKYLGINRLYEMKWIHVRILEVLHCISDMIKEETLSSAQLGIVKKSIFRAVKYGHIELVRQMCQVHPKFVKSIEESRNIFQLAAEYRQHQIYSLIFGLGEKEKNHFGTRNPDDSFPTMLHVVGNLSQLSRINNIRGAALQMQSELQWFKEVGDLVPSVFHEIVNTDGKTPREIFTENHEKLKEEAEKEMKGTAASCTVVAALIVTMMFAAAFTVPGGNKDTGDPILIDDKLFLWFIISDTLSLTTSTTAVILFLGILTSRYAEDDFLKRLPTKMMFGLFALFLSIVTMMVAFCAALTIMLEDKYSWVVTPAIVVAGIPVASFVWVQFPLLIETFKSTYLGIFDKKVESWVSL